jgi:hypothetical protein
MDRLSSKYPYLTHIRYVIFWQSLNKAYKYSVLLILLMFLSLDAIAQDSYYYLGLGLGNSNFQLNQSNIVADYASLTGASSFTDSATAFSLFGGMQLDQYVSLEMDILTAGDISAKQAGQTIKLFDVSTLAITVALSKQVSERVRLFGRIGMHWWDISESFGDLEIINNAVDITYGLGADINVYGDRSRQLRVQWNHYEYDGIYIDSNDTLSLSLLFLIGA